MIQRKDFLNTSKAGFLSVAGSSVLGANEKASSNASSSKPKRVIFFLQNQGMHPGTIRPKNIENKTQSLKNSELPEPIQALQPYADRMNIISGIHGLHTIPEHSAFFGALGGYRGGTGIAPRGITIDSKLSQILPQTILPHLCIGFDSLENMNSNPSVSTLSATGAGQGVYMHSNPEILYQTLFGSAANEKINQQFHGELEIGKKLENIAKLRSLGLPMNESKRYSSMIKGIEKNNQLSEKLANNSEHLKQFLPKYDERYKNPEFETDWHDVLLDIGIASLQSGLTNTLTIGSGRGGIYGSWKGIDVPTVGHSLGHMKQVDNPTWIKIRQYNCSMLVKVMQSLEAIPEGEGTMMDNTLIVYTSNNADYQHTKGHEWPFITIGNWGGTLQTGQFIQVKEKRPINALYTSFLHAVGEKVNRFNMDNKLALSFDPSSGPIQEILA